MDIVQIIIFIGVIMFVTAKKYKEVSDNRPQQKTTNHAPETEFIDIEDEEMSMPPFVEMEPQPGVPPFANAAPQRDVPPYGKKEKYVLSGHQTADEDRPDDFIITPKGKMIIIDTEEERFHPKAKRHKATPEVKKNKDKHAEEQPTERKGDIRLDNPAEARRAFIYSEIFNRKY